MRCMYCEKNEKLLGLMTPVISMEVSNLYLLNDQAYKGRCVLALKDHKREIYELSDEERNLYFTELANVASAIHKIFNPEKINYAVFGDIVSHLHFHLVPKYPNLETWGLPFCEKELEKLYLAQEEMSEYIALLKSELA